MRTRFMVALVAVTLLMVGGWWVQTVLAQGAPVFWFGRTRRRPHTPGFSAGSVTSDSWELASAQRFLCRR